MRVAHQHARQNAPFAEGRSVRIHRGALSGTTGLRAQLANRVPAIILEKNKRLFANKAVV